MRADVHQRIWTDLLLTRLGAGQAPPPERSRTGRSRARRGDPRADHSTPCSAVPASRARARPRRAAGVAGVDRPRRADPRGMVHVRVVWAPRAPRARGELRDARRPRAAAQRTFAGPRRTPQCGMLTFTDDEFKTAIQEDAGSSRSEPRSRSTIWRRICASRSRGSRRNGSSRQGLDFAGSSTRSRQEGCAGRLSAVAAADEPSASNIRRTLNELADWRYRSGLRG